MKITIIGSGYVGLVSAICLAKIGHDVISVDNDKEKIDNLNHGIVPIFEPNLTELLSEVKALQKIIFTTNIKQAITDCNAIFIAVGTPQGQDGSADLTFIFEVVRQIAVNSQKPQIIITKSTVPAGTGAKIAQLLADMAPNIEFSTVSNPEFLREGFAIDDFMYPERIVIGIDSLKSKKIMQEIYQYFGDEKLIFTDIVTAELAKYACNSFLATKIAFVNQMADLCEAFNGDIKKLTQIMGSDSRIGGKFLSPGPGFGGSCFPKDIKAISNFAKQADVDLSIIENVITANQVRIKKIVKKILEIVQKNKIKNCKIAFMGLAFKANTDDIRYSPAIAIIEELLKNNQDIKITASDPQADKNAEIYFSNNDNVEIFSDPYIAIFDSDIIIIATEWNEYKKLDFTKIRNITNKLKVFDLRNILDPIKIREMGFEYYGVGIS
ncbi:MAG: UDP-glucose/GDP-mannose dehydrogenase family protein [Rickettsiales bacterium]|nr:UDP-glucose/GDP-mannose dehydrogenase family protein [Rickettsiales bacterium]